MNQSSPHWTYPFENPPAEITQDTQEIQWLSTDNVQPIEQLADKTGCAEKNGDADQRGQNAAAPTPAAVQPDDNGNKPNPTPATGRDGSANSRSNAGNSGQGAAAPGEQRSFTGTIRVFFSEEELAEFQGIEDPNPGSYTGMFFVLVLDQPTNITAVSGDPAAHGKLITKFSHMIQITSGMGDNGSKLTLELAPEDMHWQTDVSVPMGEPRLSRR